MKNLNIKRLREKAGMSRSESARRMGVARPSLIAWEEGKAYPSAANLIKLADLFRCPVDKLLGRDRSA